MKSTTSLQRKNQKNILSLFKASMSKVAMPLSKEVQVLRSEIQGLIKENKFTPMKT